MNDGRLFHHWIQSMITLLDTLYMLDNIMDLFPLFSFFLCVCVCFIAEQWFKKQEKFREYTKRGPRRRRSGRSGRWRRYWHEPAMPYIDKDTYRHLQTSLPYVCLYFCVRTFVCICAYVCVCMGWGIQRWCGPRGRWVGGEGEGKIVKCSSNVDVGKPGL